MIKTFKVNKQHLKELYIVKEIKIRKSGVYIVP